MSKSALDFSVSDDSYDLVETTRGEAIHELENTMLAMPEKLKLDIDSMTQHFFGPGVYVRQFFLPKGCVVTGKIHKTSHLTIIAMGACSFATGEDAEVFIAPAVFLNKIGDKRAVYAHEDTVIMTVHPTDETDIDKLEEELVTENYEEVPWLLE